MKDIDKLPAEAKRYDATTVTAVSKSYEEDEYSILKALIEKKGTDPEVAITENNLILVWCRGDYEYQVQGIKTIQWLVRTDVR